MRPISTFAASFAATVAIAVPAAWHFLDADIRSDGKRLRSLDSTMELGDATVSMSVDKSLVMSGDSVTVKLAATAPTARDVTVDMTVFHAQVRWGERVEPAQVPIDHETIVLHATPEGGKPRTTMVKLGDRNARAGTSESYRVYIAKHGLKPSPEGDADDDITKSAAVGILAWTGNTVPLTITTEGTPRADAPFTVAVHIKNTHKHAIRQPYAELGTQISESGGIMASEDDFDIERIEATDETATDDDGEAMIKPGKEVVEKFKVTPKHHVTSVTFAASAFSYGNDMGRPTDGAMNAQTFKLADEGATVARKD